MTLNRFARWFRTVWPSPGRRAALYGQYASLSEKPLVLADIALRGRVWRPSHVPNDPTTTAWNDGRRSLALEILELAGMSADQLARLVEPRPERTDR